MAPSYLIGIDEVGRGALAGPVLVCAFGARKRWAMALPPTKDSKQMTAIGRERLFEQICAWRANGKIFFRTASISARVIDRIGIERALRRAVRRSLETHPLSNKDTVVLLDGRLRAPRMFSQRSIVRGDETVPIIAFASVVAKVTRDRLISKADRVVEGYDFAKHKGYGTRSHFDRIRSHGISPIHRVTFLSRFCSKAS